MANHPTDLSGLFLSGLSKIAKSGWVLRFASKVPSLCEEPLAGQSPARVNSERRHSSQGWRPGKLVSKNVEWVFAPLLLGSVTLRLCHEASDRIRVRSAYLMATYMYQGECLL